MAQATLPYDHAPLHSGGQTIPARPRRIRSVRLAALTLSIIALVLGGCATTGPRTSGACEPPIDQLTLLREAADTEALYTLAGGLKPMSSGFWRCTFEADDPDQVELERVREMLRVLCNDVWYADIQIFEKIHDGERNAHAFVVHQNALAGMIDRHESFWSEWNITPETHPTELVEIVDRMPRADRWRGYGYLYGYPDEAVDFFVEAGVAADDGREMGPGKDRQFMQIPTYAAETGHFTYAVPLEHVPTPTDQALAEGAARILDAYEERRPRMLDAGSTVEVLLELNMDFEHRPIDERIHAVTPVTSGAPTAR